ncbi:hypothetical protein APT98_15430 [Klebsiella quasipneumoniae]|nr:hypothetical protein APT98_15430 [Klebsiella quasipneumoniae]
MWPKFFSDDVLQLLFVKAQIGDQQYQAVIIFLQLAQMSQLSHAHAAKLLLPVVKGGFTNPHLSADFFHPRAAYLLRPGKSDQFFFIASLFHAGCSHLYKQ